MEPFEIIKFNERNQSVSISKIEKTLEKSFYENDDNEYEIAITTEKIINEYFGKKRIKKLDKCFGNPDDYHNLSVVLARVGYHNLSCKVLESGIKKYPGSVDLLADYIEYSIESENFEKGRKYFNILQSIAKKKWTWRAFDFSIDYLIFTDRINANEDNKKEIIELIKLFKTSFYDDERAYLSEANYYQLINDKERRLQALLEGIRNVKIAPLCSLKLAKIYFENGDYYNANKILKKCKHYSIHMSSENEIGDIYYLSALCEVALYYIEDIDGNSNNAKIQQICNDFKSAEKTNIRNKSSFKNLRVLIDILSEYAGVDIYE